MSKRASVVFLAVSAGLVAGLLGVLSGRDTGNGDPQIERAIPAALPEEVPAALTPAQILERELKVAATEAQQAALAPVQPQTAVRPLLPEEVLVKFDVETLGCEGSDVSAAGVVRRRYACDKQLHFEHHYDAYSFDQLMQIHETDAMASYILGMKTFHDKDWREHFDYEASVNHLHRAAVLSGKAQPYLDMLRSRQLASRQIPPTEFLREEAYVWFRAGVIAGVIQPGDQPAWMADHESIFANERLRALQARATQFATDMSNERTYKTGNTFTQ